MKKGMKIERGTLERVLTYLKPYWMLACLSILFSALSVAASLYIPILAGSAIDLIAGPNNVEFTKLAQLLLKIAVTAVIAAVMQWLINTINNRISFHVVQDVRSQAFRKIQILPLSYLDSHPSGEIVSRVIADVDQFSEGLLLGFSQLFTGAASIVGTLLFMLSIRLEVTLTVVILTPLSFVVARFIATHTHRYFKEQSEARAAQTAFIDEMIGNQKVVKAFNHEKQNIKSFDSLNERLKSASLKAIFFSSLTNPCTRFVNNVVYAAVALLGALLCVSTAGGAAAFTIGNLSSFLSYANQYTKPFNEISGVITELENALVCASRIFHLIDKEPQTPDADDAKKLTDVQGKVAFDSISFSYKPEQKLIESISLDIKPGQHVAIVGPTGCGKTTLINLLMRFYDVNSGKIELEGTDIKLLKRKELRRSFGMVLQETWLKSGTIRENIIIGKPDATDAEIIEAAKACHAHHFIMRLPQGYDTQIGEDGGSLSQGQKQLLCITRIMLSLPPMLILDEATSSIDTRTEMKIQSAFSNLMRGRTTFIVAHRLSTIREADMILVMRDGKIIETGNHEQLLEQNGFYAELYNSQFAT